MHLTTLLRVSQVKVRRRGSDTKFVAAVLAVGTECDIGESVWESSFIGHPQVCIPMHASGISQMTSRGELTTLWSAAAMLTVEDEEFWEGLCPVNFGELPRLQDQVTVIG